MAEALHGRRGYLTTSGGTIALVTSFRVKEAIGTYETTVLGETNPTHESHAFDGLKNVEGSIEALMDADAALIASGTLLTAALFAANSVRSFTGTIGVMSIDHSVNRQEEQTVSFEFKGTGDFTRA